LPERRPEEGLDPTAQYPGHGLAGGRFVHVYNPPRLAPQCDSAVAHPRQQASDRLPARNPA